LSHELYKPLISNPEQGHLFYQPHISGLILRIFLFHGAELAALSLLGLELNLNKE
jgi:hypothetical protein